MTTPIVLYDENNERVGETYHRRAKQLVRSGRAAWLEEGQSLVLASHPEHEALPPPHKEEFIMTESIYTNNGVALEAPEAPARPEGGASDLLMYLARQNVAQKRNLIKHAVAYLLVWVVLIAMPIGMVRPASMRPFTHGASSVSFGQNSSDTWAWEMPVLREPILQEPIMREIELFRQGHSNAEIQAYVFNTVMESLADSLNYMVVQSSPAWRPPVPVNVMARTVSTNNRWHFIVGVMFAWGVWIAAQGVKVAHRHLSGRPKSPYRPDPVEQEYQRLSAMS